MTNHESKLWEIIYDLRDIIKEQSSRTFEEVEEDIEEAEEESLMYEDEALEYFGEYETLDDEEWFDVLDDAED